MKNKLLILFLSLTSLFIVVKPSFAQQYKSITTFDMSNPVSETSITQQQITTGTVAVTLKPITSLLIPKDAFNEDVKLLVYQGKWDVIMQHADKGISPISAYFLVFLNSKNQEVSPLKNINVTVYNNYSKTTATVTQLAKDTGVPDPTRTQTFPNQAPALVSLPVNNSGFIVTVNKQIDKNDASLHPTVIGTIIPTSPITPIPTISTQKSFIGQNLVLILGIIVIIFFIGGLAFALLLKNPGKPNNQI